MKKLSSFADFFSTQPSHASLDEIVNLIKTNEQLKSITQAYRSTGDKRIKERSYTFAVAVFFEGGKGKQHCKSFTGLSLVDLDHVPKEKVPQLKGIIAQDPHTLLCYTTISGEGLRIIFRYELDEHASLDAQWKFYIHPYLAGNSYYQRLTGHPYDPLCKNPTRLSGMAFDPEAYYNPDAIAFRRDEITQQSKIAYKQGKEEKQRERIQGYYDTFIMPRLAEQNIVYQPGKHNDYVMRVGYMLADKGYNRKVAIQWALEKFKEYDGTEQVMRSCFDSVQKNGKSQTAGGEGGKGQRTASVQDIETYLSEHAQLRYNEVLSRIELQKDGKWQILDNQEFNNYWRDISKTIRAYASDVERILNSGFVKHFNPFVDYLEDVAQDADDGTDYILQLARTVRVKGGEEEQQLWYEFLKKWMVALVAGWLEEDEVNTVVLVFIGEQGTNKSTWQKMLMPTELRQYFSILLNAGHLSKDDKIRLVTKGLVCCEELDTMTAAELNQFKSIVTTTHIDERAPYAHFSEHRKRHASFCGNGNNAQFLSDLTGNRRWMPFEIEHIQSPREHPFPYRGIYAQAYRLYKSGFRYWFNAEESRRLNEHNKQFESSKPELELVSTYFRKPGPGETGQFVSASRALQVMGGNLSQKLNLNKISQAFIQLGFERKRYNSIRGFIVIERSGEHIKQFEKCITLNQPEPTDGDLPF